MANGAYLWLWDSVNSEWVKALGDASGHLQADVLSQPDVAQDTPENLKHLPHGRITGDGAYIPFELDANHYLMVAIKALEHLNDITDVNVPSPTDQYIFYWDATASKWQCQSIVTWLLNQLGAPDGAVAMNSQKITGLADPAAAQDAATKAYHDAVANLPAHGIAKHTDVTRTLFIPISSYTTGTYEPAGGHMGVSLDATTPEIAYCEFMTPNDFVSFSSLKVVWNSKAGGTAGYDWVCDPVAKYAADTESRIAHSDAPANTTIDVAADTWEVDIIIMGLLLTYTAEQ